MDAYHYTNPVAALAIVADDFIRPSWGDGCVWFSTRPDWDNGANQVAQDLKGGGFSILTRLDMLARFGTLARFRADSAKLMTLDAKFGMSAFSLTMGASFAGASADDWMVWSGRFDLWQGTGSDWYLDGAWVPMGAETNAAAGDLIPAGAAALCERFSDAKHPLTPLAQQYRQLFGWR
jgi:hypothetical protein